MKEITEDYVSFETAKLLKEKGFDEKCFQYWHEKDNELVHSRSPCPIRNITNPCFFGPAAPTLQMAMKWLREVHDIFIEIMIFDEEDRIGLSEDERYCWNIHYNSTGNIRPFDGTAKTPEEACEAAIKYCLENLI